MSTSNPFRYFKMSPEIIRMAVMLYLRFALWLRNVEDLLDERGIDVSHETVRFWWNRFGPVVGRQLRSKCREGLFATEVRKRRVEPLRSSRWRWHLDEVFVKINGTTHDLWRAVDQEGVVLVAVVTKKRDRKAALNRRSAERNSCEN